MSDATDRDEKPLLLGRDNAGVATAPARRFDEAARKPQTLFSHVFFAMMAVGAGAYLDKVHDTVNPDPNAREQDSDQAPAADHDKQDAVSEVSLVEQLSNFWQKFLDEYAETTTPVAHVLRHRGHEAGPRTGDFQIPDAVSQQPWRMMRVNSLKDTIDFVVPGPGSVRLAFDTPDTAGGSTSQDSIGSPGSGQGGNAAPTEPANHAGPGTANANAGGNGSGPGNSTRPNRLPVLTGPVFLGTGLVNLSILLSLSDLARAATDPDGDSLTVSNIRTSSGSIRAYGTDAWIFTPDRDMQGIVSFQFSLGDGHGFVIGKGWLDLRPHGPSEIRGTDGDDVLLGTPQDDIIDAGAGNDVVYGREKADMILGGDGDDRLLGGDGADIIHGGNGNDWIFGGRGDDVILGDAGDDIVFGEEGRDSIQGGDGDDRISGGAGSDRIFGEAGNDILSGDAGDDVLEGGAGHDRLAGGIGHDVAFGGAGNDRFIAGADTALSEEASAPDAAPDPADGNDTFDGGAGIDTYDASGTVSGVLIDLSTGMATGVEIGTDQLIAVENAIGGAGNDMVVASEAVNVMTGGDGADIFVFSQTSHLSNSGSGRDEIRDFEIGDKIDLTKLGRELGHLHFSDGDTLVTELDSNEHKTLIKLFREMSDHGDQVQVVQFLANIDGDHTYELVVISATDLSNSDFILTATEIPLDPVAYHL